MLALFDDPVPLDTALWTLALAVSWMGWGALAGRLLLQRQARDAGWGLQTVWGFSFVIAIGGLLNLAGVISVPVAIGVTLTGVALCLLLGAARVAAVVRGGTAVERARVRAVLLQALPIVALVGTAAWALRTWLPCCGLTGGVDDTSGFAVFPLKMLEAGRLSVDPFNRTQTSSLGGQAFLQALLLARLPVTNIGALDPPLSLLLIVGTLVGYQRARGAGGVSTWLAGALPCLLLLNRPENAGAYVSLIAAFIGLGATLDWIEGHAVRTPARACLVGLVVAALAALKISALPFAALLPALHYLRRFFAAPAGGARRGVALEALGAAAISFALLAPWVAGTHAWEGGIPLVLGAASPDGVVTGPLYGDRVAYTRLSDVAGDAFLPQAAIVAALFWAVTRGGRGTYRSTSILAATALAGTVALRLASAGSANPPIAAGAILVMVADLLRMGEARIVAVATSIARTWQLRMAAGAIALTVALGIVLTAAPAIARPVRYFLAKVPRVIANRVNLPPHEPETPYAREHAAALRTAQAAIPAGTAAAARVEEPFLLDFSRNDLNVIDFALVAEHDRAPGAGADPIAAHLLRRNIRYVLYEDVGDRNLRDQTIDCRTAAAAERVAARRHGESSDYIVTCTEDAAIASFLGNLRVLTATRRHLYDDGQFVVLDLAARP